MEKELFNELENYRKRQKLSILALCRQLGANNVTYHRWKNTQKITGPYKKIVADFLVKNADPKHIKISKLINSSLSKQTLQASSDIAIIGIACYYPGASNIPELWENILARRIQFRRMLDGRLPLNQYYDSDLKSSDKTYLTQAAFLENFEFDWAKLRIPKRTFESTDIAHWLALDTALKTFENAGYKLNEIPTENTGVIVGNTLTGEQTRSQSLRLRWPYVQKVLNATLNNLGVSPVERGNCAVEMEKIFKSAFYPITEDSLAGGLANTIAGRICNYLNLKGGGYIVDGACSSSLLAVATAADALKMLNVDLVLAGGVDISLDPFELVGFARAGALAKEKMCVYDQRANGFLPGEGCGFVLLKRLDDALKARNYIYAVIKGWGISSDGHGGIMEPSSNGQALAIGRAYKNLEYKVSNLDFIEGHGTGTAKGDQVELEGMIAAITNALDKKEVKRICGVTSFKSIVGHTKAAAGVGGFIKAVLGVNQRILPPTANCEQPNEVFEREEKYIYPIIQGAVLPKEKHVRAGISSAGFGGINCHIGIESYGKPADKITPKLDERALFVSNQTNEVFTFASKNVSHLIKIIRKYKEDLRFISIAEMADLAFFLNTQGKGRAPVKAAIVTDSPENLYEALNVLEKELENNTIQEGDIHRLKINHPNTHIVLSHSHKKSRIGFLYPGQASQKINMTRVLFERFAWVRDLLQKSIPSLSDSIYKPTDKFLTQEEQKEFEKKLSETEVTQPAVVFSSLAWTGFLSKLGIEPQSVGGNSLGELTAFYKAGAFNKETLIKFAEFRGRSMAHSGQSMGRMMSLICSKQKAQELIEKVVGNIVLANINSPTQMVVSGGKKEIETIVSLARKDEIQTYPLNVSNAFHSSFMDEASQKIQSTKFLSGSFNPNSINVYSCMDGEAVRKKIDLKEYFAKQVISPVQFVDMVESISKECDLLVEVGPGRVLTDLVRLINKNEGPACLPVESTPQNDRDLNVVIAEMFVRNVPIHFEELYHNRLIRPFVPPSKKKFIENQCERPLKIGDRIIKSEAPELKTIEQAVDPVQKVLGEEEIKESTPIVQGKDNIADLLIDLTHKMTGFDQKSITLDLRLLDDLNLDSIKAAELIGQAAKTLGIAGELDPSQFSRNTLAKIRDRLDDLVRQVPSARGEALTENVLKRYRDKTWVRNFVVDFKEEEITAKNVNQFKKIKNVVIISHKADELVEKIEKQFDGNKAKIHQFSFDDLNEAKIKKISKIDCLVTILPHPSKTSGFDKNKLKNTIERLQKLIHLAVSSHLQKDSFVIFVQFGGGRFGENDSLKDIESSCAKALASTLHLEEMDLKVRIVDFDAASPLNLISSKIVDELQTYDRFSAVGYDSKLRRKVLYYENSQPAEYKKRNILWSIKDVVLVTGGAKGITAQCALEFAKGTKARMILVGRSSAPKGKDDKNEITQTLKQFEKDKLNCHYYQCDVTDESDVVNTIHEIERKFGKITGVIHGAGLNSLKRFKQATVQEAFHEALPKVIGVVNICKALSKNPPKLIAGITSIIGLTGMEGSGWYGFANEVLNLYLHQFKNQYPKTEVVTIAYSIWDEVGMGVKLGSVNRLSEKGIGAIPVQEGVKRFRQLVENDPGCQQVIVAARIAGIDTWKSISLKENDSRFMEKIEYSLPEVELIARANLNVRDDPYVLDHNWKGSLLFPFVFGLEAMTQAVAYVTNYDKFSQLKITDIHLDRPIPVSSETGTTIEIHAQVLEKDKKDETQKVRVEIYSEQTGYKEPHFSAVFEIDGEIKAGKTKNDLKGRAESTLDIDPQRDLYGPILFQGKMFQGIDKIHKLFYNEKTRKGECLLTIDYNKSVDQFLKSASKFKNHLLIGDPFFIDSVFQSMQLIIPQDISLPVYIEGIALSLDKNISSEKHVAKSNIEKIGSEHYRGDAEVISGKLTLKIGNCRLKILDTLADNPSANDLVNPTQRDQEIIRRKLDELSNELGFVSPVVRCLYTVRLKNATKELRHKIELPVIKLAVEELLKRDKKSLKGFKVRWNRLGKPFVEVKGFKDIGVSISHDGAFLMVVAGYGQQGCDVETIQERNKNEWMALLGKEKFILFEKLAYYEKDINERATTIWCVSEAIKKLAGKYTANIRLENFSQEVTIFRSVDLENNLAILSIGLKPIRGWKKIIAISVNSKERYHVAEQRFGDNHFKKSFLKQFGFDEKLFGIDMDYSGPQRQLVFTKKFPVTFRASQHLSRKVYFTNYFKWIGEMREYGSYPIFGDLAKLAEKGGWGMATNWVKLNVLGEIKPSDTVEAKLWVDNVTGDMREIIDMGFEWRRISLDGKYERAAIAKQRITWLKILGHGVAKVERLPDFLRKFFDDMSPITKKVVSLRKMPEIYIDIDIGSKIFSSKDSIKNKHKLYEEVFPTSMENSNLIGNIYFANYAEWLGTVRDLYIYKIIPQYYVGLGEKGELVCLNCDIDHLNEGMPFDRILVQMYLDTLYECGMDLHFEFFLLDGKNIKKKLAFAKHRAVWMKWQDQKPVIIKLPPEILNRLGKKQDLVSIK